MTSALGPILSGWLVQNAGWRWAFFIDVPLAAAVLFLACTSRKAATQGAGLLDRCDALCATLRLGGLVEASSRGFGDLLAIIVLGIVVAASLAQNQAEHLDALAVAPMVRHAIEVNAAAWPGS